MNSKEIARGYKSIVTMEDRKVIIDKADGTTPPKDFTFDHCYYVDSTQTEVYRDLGSPLLNQVVDGFNATIFAYGQTGSGKSFSMTG
jgi:hypothetical protein